MIFGEFNSKGELIFEIGLIAADGEIIPVQALLDTGFTGTLAIDISRCSLVGMVTGKSERRYADGAGRSTI